MGRVFSQAALQHFERRYRNEVRPRRPGGGCMRAVYTGLGALYGDRYDFKGPFFKEFRRDNYRLARTWVARNHPDLSGDARKLAVEGRERNLNGIKRVFTRLEGEGLLSAPLVFSDRRGQWRLSGNAGVVSIEDQLRQVVDPLPDGSHFFGVAAGGGWHSLLLVVEKSGAGTRVLWMDQFSNGFGACRPRAFVDTPDVTGRLDDELREVGDRAPTHEVTIWHLQPDMAKDETVPFDSTGDGVPDTTMPATVLVPGGPAAPAHPAAGEPEGPTGMLPATHDESDLEDDGFESEPPDDIDYAYASADESYEPGYAGFLQDSAYSSLEIDGTDTEIVDDPANSHADEQGSQAADLSTASDEISDDDVSPEETGDYWSGSSTDADTDGTSDGLAAADEIPDDAADSHAGEHGGHADDMTAASDEIPNALGDDPADVDGSSQSDSGSERDGTDYSASPDEPASVDPVDAPVAPEVSEPVEGVEAPSAGP